MQRLKSHCEQGRYLCMPMNWNIQEIPLLAASSGLSLLHISVSSAATACALSAETAMFSLHFFLGLSLCIHYALFCISVSQQQIAGSGRQPDCIICSLYLTMPCDWAFCTTSSTAQVRKVPPSLHSFAYPSSICLGKALLQAPLLVLQYTG